MQWWQWNTSQWIEAKPLVNIAASGLKRFIWQNIICCFGVPREIAIDIAKQFDYHIFNDFCHQMGVKAAFVSIYHYESNGAVEKANTLIFTAIKKVLEDQPKGKWAEELPRAIWSHNTSVCRATKFTPFRLLYGEEPVTPEEIKFCSPRLGYFHLADNECRVLEHSWNTDSFNRFYI
jgi:hypothetical protein